jgi:hypothetical protein
LCIGRARLVLVVGKLRVQPRLSITPDMSEPGTLTQVKRSEAEAGNVSTFRNRRMSVCRLGKAYLHFAFQEGSEACCESKSRRV